MALSVCEAPLPSVLPESCHAQGLGHSSGICRSPEPVTPAVGDGQLVLTQLREVLPNHPEPDVEDFGEYRSRDSLRRMQVLVHPGGGFAESRTRPGVVAEIDGSELSRTHIDTPPLYGVCSRGFTLGLSGELREDGPACCVGTS